MTSADPDPRAAGGSAALVPAARVAVALEAIDGWEVDHAAAIVVAPDGPVASRGDVDRIFRWASVTKPFTAAVVLLEVEAGTIDLDEPAGPPGATVRHLLAHASGLPFEGRQPISLPERTRIYSNAGFDMLGELVAERAGEPFAAVLAGRLLRPLGIERTELRERPSAGLWGPVSELARFGAELLRPRVLAPSSVRLMTSVAFPGLRGILPGFGRYDPMDWGLGVDIRDAKVPHWTGSANSPRTFGHFGGAGTFLWVDPDAGLALACLTDREFGPWALTAWPALSDAVLDAWAVRHLPATSSSRPSP